MYPFILRIYFCINLFFLVLLSFLKTIINESLYWKSLDLYYTHPLELFNGNLFILHSKGVIVYNYNFTIILYQYNFGGSILISSDEQNELTSIIQCNDNTNQYVIALIYKDIYIFSSIGKYIFHKVNTNIFSSLSTSIYYECYTFLYYKNEDSLYHFILVFKNTDELIQFNKLKIDMTKKTYELYGEKNFTVENLLSDCLTCHFTNFEEYQNILVCFYLKKKDYKMKLMISFFNQENNFLNINETEILDTYCINENYLIKSSINKQKNKIIAFFTSKTGDNFRWIFCDIESFQFTELENGNDCKFNNKLVKINYISLLNDFIISCKNNNGISLLKFINITDYSQLSNSKKSSQLDYSNNNCTNLLNYNIIFLIFEGKYYSINNYNCNETYNEVYYFPYSLSVEVYPKVPGEPNSNFFYTYDTSNTGTTILTSIPTIIL